MLTYSHFNLASCALKQKQKNMEEETTNISLGLNCVLMHMASRCICFSMKSISLSSLPGDALRSKFYDSVTVIYLTAVCHHNIHVTSHTRVLGTVKPQLYKSKTKRHDAAIVLKGVDASSRIKRIIVKKLNSLKHLVRSTTVAT